MSDKAEISQALLGFIKSTVLDKEVQITAETPFDHLGIDSLSIIELVLFIERRYRVIIPEEELIPENLVSVEALAACTSRHLPK